MSLDVYLRRRNFSRTTEPRCDIQVGERSHNGERIYIIQKHAASHLHYDLRLEKDGVLKSWAIPKEPPTIKGIKRLAIQTEDHPIEYANFEGVIPKGEYGAGKVEIWDRGTFNVEEWGDEKIIIHIHGEKLKGRYCLIRFKKQENSWLLLQNLALPKGSINKEDRLTWVLGGKLSIMMTRSNVNETGDECFGV